MGDKDARASALLGLSGQSPTMARRYRSASSAKGWLPRASTSPLSRSSPLLAGMAGTAGRGPAIGGAALDAGPREIEGVRVTRVPGDRAWEPVVAVVEAFRPRSFTSMSIAIWPWSDTRPGGRARAVLTIHELFVSEPGQPGSLTDRQGRGTRSHSPTASSCPPPMRPPVWNTIIPPPGIGSG